MEKNILKDKVINMNRNKEVEQEKSLEKIKRFLSDKKNNNSYSFFKNFLYNNTDNESKNDISNKKIIKVNTDNRSKPKNKSISRKNNNSNKTEKKKIKPIISLEDDNISIIQKINKFELKIGNLLNLINDFEAKYIQSTETQRIKDQFHNIINKKIYKDRICNDFNHKSWIQTEINNDIIMNKENRSILKESYIMDIKNINISINNNNYQNNYFITQTSHNKYNHHKYFNQKQNSSDKKFNIKINNNSVFKKSLLKSLKKKPKCISNDTKNKIIQTYKDKTKLFKLPLEYIINNNNINKNSINNYRYNNSYKEYKKPLTDRKEKEINEKTNNKKLSKNKLNSENKKGHDCLKINKMMFGKEEKEKKPFIQSEAIKKENLLKTKKIVFNKSNNTTSILKANILGNLSNNRGKSNKEKSNINNINLNQKKDNANNINYSLNKKKFLKRNNVITFNMKNKI